MPALIGVETIDGTLDVEQCIDTLDCGKRDRRDRRRRPSSSGVLGDIGQFEELPPGMRPTESRCDGRRLVQTVEAAIGIGLKDAGEALQMADRMLATPSREA